MYNNNIYNSAAFNTLSKHRKIIIIISAIFACALVVMLIAIIINSNREPHDAIKVSDYANLPSDIPNDTKENLQRHIYTILSSHFDTSSHQGSISATIRPDTIENGNQGAAKYVTYVLDIDDYQQSYNVSMTWSDSIYVTDDISVECTTKNVSKYPDALCYGTYYNSDSPHLYLPYEGKTNSGISYSADYGYKDVYGFEHIDVVSHSCNGDNTQSEIIAAVKKYLKDTGGLNTEQFVYSYTADYAKCNF